MNSVRLIENADDSEIATWIETRLNRFLGERDGPVTVALPGGSTPPPIIRKLVERDFDFSRLVVWPGDDRQVPADHEASNEGMLRNLFEPAGTEVVTLTIMEQVPQFDLVWLGMGSDGHIASLFPNTDPEGDDPEPIRRLIPDPLPDDAPYARVSLTIPSLTNTKELMLVVRGREKRRILDEAIAGKNDLPIARLLKAAEQPVTCFV